MEQRYGGDVTDVPGIRVGHWTDEVGLTGCTVVLLPDEGAAASVDVRGAAPGTRETDLLSPDNTVQVAHAVLLTGGSAFGLAAADGVMQRLEERGIGVPAGPALVPIVPAAVLFDLGYGDVAARPDAAAGRAAILAAESGGSCGSGPVGAGAGATVGKLLGNPTPAGLGTASLRLPGGATVGAVAAVNAVGDVVDGSGQVLAGPGTVAHLLTQGAPAPPVAGTNTTLALVATDARLTKTQAHRLAVVAHDAYALAIRPVHTPYDGDTMFAVSTGSADPVDDLVLQTAAVEVLASAIRNAVRPR
jgi:L-aminopeptidase/D-esterase-like protein